MPKAGASRRMQPPRPRRWWAAAAVPAAAVVGVGGVTGWGGGGGGGGRSRLREDRDRPKARPSSRPRGPSFPSDPPEPGAHKIEGRRQGRDDHRYFPGDTIHAPKVAVPGGGDDGHYYTVIVAKLFPPNEDLDFFDWTELAWVRAATDAEAAEASERVAKAQAAKVAAEWKAKERRHVIDGFRTWLEGLGYASVAAGAEGSPYTDAEVAKRVLLDPQPLYHGMDPVPAGSLAQGASSTLRIGIIPGGGPVVVREDYYSYDDYCSSWWAPKDFSWV